MNVYIGGAKSDYSAMRGPAPEGFHVPLTTEWQGLKTIMDGLGLTSGNNWRINLHIPFAGNRSLSNANLSYQGTYGYYWSSSPYGSGMPNAARDLRLDSSYVYADDRYERARGFSVRCFKNSFELPTSSWAVIQGTLGSAGIFWDTVNGLISITGDGTTGYTIQDKNLGATTVYNDGDTLSEVNCGKYYQWGNNYGFAWTGSVTTSSTQVNASTYGPGNYYSSSTFITGSQDWSSVHNDNLRGGETGIVMVPAPLKNDYIGEVWTPGSNTLAYFPFKSDINNHYGNDGNWYVYSGSVSYENNMMKYTGQLRKNKATLSGGYSGNFTVLSWRKREGTDARIDLWRVDFSLNSGMSIPGGNSELCSVYVGGSWYAISLPQMTNGVHLFAMVRNGNTLYGYLDGNLIGSKSISGSLNSTLSCGAISGAGGTIGETIAENKAWTQQEISHYYDITKSNYGLS